LELQTVSALDSKGPIGMHCHKTLFSSHIF
jgi:hypothetical protein